ncbi:phosphate regulon sensor histidine kinase PhoR [Halorhodospira halochloris]|uniref:phosphate regulon sensor histidine kinase PhoR n=1 Tax=Halorhodospira halochloris TaxID=1052 RepID=UPI001EE8E50C|nr:phosphate regulon sensor histidine kinase PhoR [Halorhodospira halochloris]MCG5549225.1 phosphate regulon sensor histidine kinase PhoR [Halorhodospira halochloris]
MLTRSPWPSFWARLSALSGVAAGLAFVTGWWLEILSLLLGLVFIWNLWQLSRLERWVRLGRRVEPPLSWGLWGELFHALSRRQRRQRERQQRLRGLIREYRDSAKAMPDATVVLQRGDRVVWWNDAAKRLLGLRWPDDERQHITNLIRSSELREYIRHGYSGEPLSLTSPVRRGTTLEVRLVPYGRDQRLLIARDTTRTERLETMRRDFVSNVSHELKTPLTVIYGVADEMRDELAAKEPEWAQPIQLLHEQAQRMQTLVQDLLMLSRLETAAPSPEQWPVDVGNLLDKLCAESRALSGDRGHQIELEAEPGLQIYGSESELRSAFSNLLSNAVRYTPDGGKIRVRWFSDANGAYGVVEDTGIGIPQEHINRLTERFYRVDKGRSNATGGTGLGLAIVKHVMQRHAGRLHIKSTPDKGSEFMLVFPRRVISGRSIY